MLVKDRSPEKIKELTSNNQRLELCIRSVLLPYNEDLRFFFFFFWLTTYNRHGHNLVLLKFTIKQLEIVKIHLDQYDQVNKSVNTGNTMRSVETKMCVISFARRHVT